MYLSTLSENLQLDPMPAADWLDSPERQTLKKEDEEEEEEEEEKEEKEEEEEESLFNPN